MKRKIFILVGILVSIYVVLTIVDTSEYRVEKRLWRMREQFKDIAKDPKAVPDAQFQKVISGYERLIARYPDSGYVPQMYSSIGSLYVMNKKYEESRKAFGQIIGKFADNPVVISKAMMDIGATYLAEGKTGKAIDVYQRIWDEYSYTEIGFMMPLYIAGIYRKQGDMDKVADYLGRAEIFYRKIAEDSGNPELLRLNAYQTLATAYISKQDFQTALTTLKTILYDFADSPGMTPQRLSAVTRMLNMIFIGQMRDFDRAINFYQKFISAHPGHRLNIYLEKVIESLNMIEQKNLVPAAAQK